jgi:hypothetical protein
LNDQQEATSLYRLGETIHIELTLDSGDVVLDAPRLNFPIYNSEGLRVCNLSTEHTYPTEFAIQGETVITCSMEDIRIAPDVYHIDIGLKDKAQRQDSIPSAILFEIIPSDIYDTGKTDRTGSLFEPKLTWKVESRRESMLLQD